MAPTTASALVLALGLISWPSLGSADQYQYDVQGHLTQVTYSNGGITGYTYDANGNILAITSSLNATGVEETSGPVQFALGQNVPNPGAGLMTIRFSIPIAGAVALRVFDVRGRLVMTPLDARLPAGAYAARIDASRFSGGVYYYKLESGGRTLTRRLVVLP